MKQSQINALNILNNISEDTTADLLEKAMGHKYYRREGGPGNYKYYYTREQYNKEKRVEEEDKSPLEIIKEFEDNTKFLNNKIQTLKNKLDNEDLPEGKILKIKKDIKTFSDKISFNDKKINSLRGKVEPGSHLKDNMTIGELAESYIGKKNGDYNMQKYIQGFVKKQIDLPKDSKIYFDGVDLVLNDKVVSKDALKTNKKLGDIIKDVKNSKDKAQYDIGEKVKFFDNGRNKNFKGTIKDYKEVDGQATYSIKIDGRTDVVEGITQKDIGKNI